MILSRQENRSPLKALILALGAAGAEPAHAAPEGRVELSGSYVSDMLANMSGGRRGGAALLGKATVAATIDGSAIGIDGASAYLSAELVHGRSLSEELVGDAQVASNIEAPSALRPFEAWIEFPVEERLAAKIGLIDLNSEFDVQRVGQLFLNSSHGIGPDFAQSGLNGPSIFPTTAPAFMLRREHGGGAVRIGLFDAVAGDPDHPKRTRIRMPGKQGFLLVGEVDQAIGGGIEVQLGAWGYTARFERIGSGERRRGNRGAYAMIEARLAGEEEGPSLDGWIRVGVAEAEFNPIGVYWGGGLAYGADDQRIGFAFAHARLGDRSIRAAEIRPRRAETNFELTYSRQVAPWLTVQPDVQYVVNPGWDASLRNALVAGVRLRFELP